MARGGRSRRPAGAPIPSPDGARAGPIDQTASLVSCGTDPAAALEEWFVPLTGAWRRIAATMSRLRSSSTMGSSSSADWMSSRACMRRAADGAPSAAAGATFPH